MGATYNFRNFADDGVRLRIGGTDVIVDNSYHAEQQRLGSIFLTSGGHALELVFFEGGGEASLEFSVAQGVSSTNYQHIPSLQGVTTTAPSVPEPATVAVLGLGLLATGALRRRRSQ